MIGVWRDIKLYAQTDFDNKKKKLQIHPLNKINKQKITMFFRTWCL